MSCPVVVVWGKNGSGKTTCAVNLACLLADTQKIVGLISSNLYYPELQSFLDFRVSPEKGSHAALSSYSIAQTQSFFVESGSNKNVFVLSPPNQCNAINACEQDKEEVERLIDRSRLSFDYLVIDGSADLQSAITFLSMRLASYILTLYPVTISAGLWHQSHSLIFQHLHMTDRMINVLNADNNACERDVFLSAIGFKPEYELPYVPKADIYANSGKPIIYQSEKYALSYRKTLDKILLHVMDKSSVLAGKRGLL